MIHLCGNTQCFCLEYAGQQCPQAGTGPGNNEVETGTDCGTRSCSEHQQREAHQRQTGGDSACSRCSGENQNCLSPDLRLREVNRTQRGERGGLVSWALVDNCFQVAQAKLSWSRDIDVSKSEAVKAALQEQEVTWQKRTQERVAQGTWTMSDWLWRTSLLHIPLLWQWCACFTAANCRDIFKRFQFEKVCCFTNWCFLF